MREAYNETCAHIRSVEELKNVIASNVAAMWFHSQPQ